MSDYCLLSKEKLKYLRLLSEKYPTWQAACTEIINLQAISNLPKGTEHFMSDLHGEYDAFYHILNNCSGVIREKVGTLFADSLFPGEQSDLCTLIYYPKEKMKRIRESGRNSPQWYSVTLHNLVELAKLLSSKYTRSKVRKALPKEFSYIIDELLHAQPDEDNNRLVYHAKIIDTILETGSADDFIFALTALVKRLAVDHLHIVGDIFDRGPHADKIMDLLLDYHSLDIEWGNHDILWMGAAAGSDACVAAVVRNNVAYGNMEILESGYGISLRPLALFAEKTYTGCSAMSGLVKAVSSILFKLEGQIIRRHPEYDMADRLLQEKIDFGNGRILIDGKIYQLNTEDFPTVDPDHPYELTPEEAEIIADLRTAFQQSERLNRHVSFLYSHGSLYRCFNQNLLFHGCVPLDAEGNFEDVECAGRLYRGKAYMDCADRIARQAYLNRDQYSLDFMWYLWCGKKSPLSGRTVKTFERTYIADKQAWEEPQNAYYKYRLTEATCTMILREFGLLGANSHIINGHRPVKASEGESPVKANGKLIVIDGGFCRAYQSTTGIAGYTLIFNSHGMRIKSHRSFQSVEKALDNADIESKTEMVEIEPRRIMVGDSDVGKMIYQSIRDLQALLSAYKEGLLQEHRI